MLKRLIKNFLYFVAPRRTTEWMSARSRVHSQFVARSWGCGEIAELVFANLGDRVVEGPFSGLKLSQMTKSEHVTPFLLGTYENELNSAWEVVFAGDYDRLIDVGAKFGFYAVGLAKRYPQATVVAFDTDFWARDAMREMSRANGVDNVRVEGYCDRSSLVANAGEATFVISDCEGYEAQLFDEEVVTRLRKAVMIIEAHDCLVPGVTKKLTDLISRSHKVFTIGSDDNGKSSRYRLDFLTDDQRALAVKEVRPEQDWLLCLPKSGPNAELAGRYKAMKP